jgi:hypothetical protein
LYGATGILLIIVLSSRSVILFGSVAGRDVFQMPAQQQAVDVSRHFHIPEPNKFTGKLQPTKPNLDVNNVVL